MARAVRPLSWLKTTFSYQLALTDYEATTDPLHSATNAALVENPGGHVFAGEYDSATYSANVTLTPWRRFYISTTFSYQDSRIATADSGSPAVVPYKGDIINVLANATYILTERTDLTGTYSFSRANYGQNNFASGLPLGIDYEMHGVQTGITHRWKKNLITTLQYGWFKYEEPTSAGFNDYTAHMIFATATIRWPE